jgi:hypothetical protein
VVGDPSPAFGSAVRTKPEAPQPLQSAMRSCQGRISSPSRHCVVKLKLIYYQKARIQNPEPHRDHGKRLRLPCYPKPKTPRTNSWLLAHRAQGVLDVGER